jgi:hypothetical protein
MTPQVARQLAEDANEAHYKNYKQLILTAIQNIAINGEFQLEIKNHNLF